MYKCNEQRTININRLDTWLNIKRGITIRKKLVIDITMREAEILYQALGSYLNKPEFQADMKKARARNWK